MSKLKTLGKKVTKFAGLEVFPAPTGLQRVICFTDEVTALCPVTGQPDWYQVKIDYIPQKLCVESKTLKLYLQSFRNTGHFCEKFSSIIAHEIQRVLDPLKVSVTIEQKPRGGIAIEATCVL